MALQLVTYNLWHGLSGRGLVKVDELEPKRRTQQRTLAQLDLLQELKPDVVFLQEVNPLHEKHALFTELLGMDGECQSDLCGIKLQFLGPPFNLNSGLMILAKPEFHLKRIRGLKLSGPVGFAGPRFSFQLHESRYALICELEVPKLGRLLLINTHLHHGFELTPQLAAELDELETQDVISMSEHSQMLSYFRDATRRRQHELSVLLTYVETIQLDYDGLIFAGDFNVDPQSETIHRLATRGWVDIAAPYKLCSWDRSRNEFNMKLNENFELPLPDLGKSALRQVLLQHMFRRTRLDYILTSRNLAGFVENCHLIGDLLDPEQIPSDHFGVFALLC